MNLRSLSITIILLLGACGPAPLDLNSHLTSFEKEALRIIPEAQMQKYKENLPRVAFPELDAVLRSSATFWYDSQTIIPAYQDDDGSPMGMRDNSSGQTIGLAQHLFEGKHWVFPFSQTAGTDRSPNKVVANFLALPVENGEIIPIGYHLYNPQYDKRSYEWQFPVGTMIGEIIYLPHPSNSKLYVSEIRIRRRYKDNWAANVFRPFPTAKHLEEAIIRLRPQWQSHPRLAALISHLRQDNTLQPASLKPQITKQPNGAGSQKRSVQAQNEITARLSQVFSEDGHLDILPNIDDPQLVVELLTTTPFISSYGLPWKKNENSETFAASTKEAFSIVPQNYEAGLIAVNDVSCQRCHAFAGQAIGQFDRFAVAYGSIWGNDGIFSFHLFETERFYNPQPNNLGSHVVNFNNDNRTIRKQFLDHGLVKQITSPAKDPNALYTHIPKANIK